MTKFANNHSFNIGLIITLCVLAYLPGLTDFMFVDDLPNISNNNSIKITRLDFDNLISAATTNDSGPLGRPISSLSFALNYYFSGQQIIPSHFKATNLAIHIANSILIYIMTLILLSVINKRTELHNANKRLGLALLITLLWALHPIQLTAILYSVQRMTSMATFFMLAGLITYMLGRHRLEENRPHAKTLMYGGIILGTALGALCKEIALLLPFYAGAIELTLHSKSKANKKNIKIFYLAMVAIPSAIGIIYLASHPQFVLGGYTFRDFTVFERLLTEPRVLFYYIWLIAYPNLGQLTLHHDDILISRNLLTPPTTLFALSGIALLLLSSLILRKKQAVFSLMVLWFFVGHAMESTFFGLEIAYEHRNYLPSYGIIFGAVLFVYLFLLRITNRNLLKTIIAIVALASMFFTTFTRATIWSEPGTIAHFDHRNHPNSARSQTMYADHLLKINTPIPQVYEQVRIASSLNTNEVGPIIDLYKLLKIMEMNIDAFSEYHVEKTTNPVSYDAPLIVNKKYIKKLAVLVDNEIGRRLHGKIATHRAAMVLRELSYCILREDPDCTPLISNAINWLDIVTSNTRHSDKTLAITYYFLAKLKAYTGDTKSALYYMDKSLSARPDDFSLLIDKVNLYLTIGDTENAGKLIQALERRDDMPENFRRDLGNSKDYLQTLRDTATADVMKP